MACAGQKPGGSLFCSHHTWMCSVCIRLKKTAQSASHRQGFWTTTGVHRIYFSLAGEAFNTPKILSRQCLSQTSWEPVMWYPKSIQFCVRLHWKRIMEEPNQHVKTGLVGKMRISDREQSGVMPSSWSSHKYTKQHRKKRGKIILVVFTFVSVARQA